MLEMEDDLDRELGRLAAATAGVRPSPGFVRRVASAIEPLRAPGFGDGVMRFGKAMLAIATLSAAFAVFAGVRSEHKSADAFASAYWMEDFDW
jgi:hypothetical protein